MRFLPLWVALVAACGTESEALNGDRESGAQTPDDRMDASAARTPDHRADAGPVRNISVAGTLVERALNAPSKSVNGTSWQGVANGTYLRFALYGDGLGTIAVPSMVTDFSWVLSGQDTVTFSGNPWFGDLTIVEFSDPRTFMATSRSGGVFGQRWELNDTIPSW